MGSGVWLVFVFFSLAGFVVNFARLLVPHGNGVMVRFEMKCVLQALSSIDIGSLICNVGAGGGAPAGAAPAAAPAAGNDAPGMFVVDLCL